MAVLRLAHQIGIALVILRTVQVRERAWRTWQADGMRVGGIWQRHGPGIEADGTCYSQKAKQHHDDTVYTIPRRMKVVTEEKKKINERQNARKDGNKETIAEASGV